MKKIIFYDIICSYFFRRGWCRVTWLFEKILDLVAGILSYVFLFLFSLITDTIKLSPVYNGPDSTLHLALTTFPMLDTVFVLLKYTAYFIMGIMFIYHLFKNFFGNMVQVEPLHRLVFKYFFFSALTTLAKPLCSVFFAIGAAPYAAFSVMETPEVKIVLADVIGSRLSGKDALLNLGEDGVSLAVSSSAVMMFILLWILCGIGLEFFRLFTELFERYVMLTVFSIFSPICIAMGAFQATEIIFKSWMKMMISHCVMMCVNVVFIRVFISSFGTIGKADLTGNSFALTLFLLLGWLVVGQRADAHLSALGLQTAQTGGLGQSMMMAYRMAGETAAQGTNKIFGMAANTKLGQMMGVSNPHMTTIRSKAGQDVPGSKTGEKFTSPFNIAARNGMSRGMGLQLAGHGNPAMEVNTLNKLRRMVDPQGTIGGGLQSIFKGEVGDSKSEKTKENGEAIMSNFKKDPTGNMKKLQEAGFQLEGGMAKKGQYELSGKDKDGNDITATIQSKKDDQHNIPVTANDGSEQWMSVKSGQGVNSEVTKAFTGEGGMDMKETAGSLASDGKAVESDQKISENPANMQTKEANANSLEGSGNLVQMADGSIAPVELDSNGKLMQFDENGKADPQGGHLKNAETGELIPGSFVAQYGDVRAGQAEGVNITDGANVLSADGKSHSAMAAKISSGNNAATLEKSPQTGDAVGYKMGDDGKMVPVSPKDASSATHFKATLSDGTTGFVPKSDVGIGATMMSNGKLHGSAGIASSSTSASFSAGDQKNLEVGNNGKLQGYTKTADGLEKVSGNQVATHYRQAGTDNYIPASKVGQNMMTSGNAVSTNGSSIANFAASTGGAVAIARSASGIAQEYKMENGQMQPVQAGTGTHFLARAGKDEGYVSKAATGISASVSPGFTGYSQNGEVSSSFNQSISNAGGKVSLQPSVDGMAPARFNMVNGEMKESQSGEYYKATTADGNSGYLKASSGGGYISQGLAAGAVMERPNADGSTSYFRNMGDGTVGVTSNKAEAYASTPLQAGSILHDTGSGSNGGHFALGANSFDSSGNLRVYQDSTGASYINDNRGTAHAVSDIQTNAHQGFSTFSGGNTGTHVQTENGLRYVQGGAAENVAGVQTYSQDPSTGEFSVSRSGSGTHVMVASHVGGPVFERLADNQVNDAGQVRTYNYQSESGGGSVSFGTSPFREGGSLSPVSSYSPSSSGSYYRDDSGNYRDASLVKRDDSGEMIRYERGATGYYASPTGGYVAEVRENSAGQSKVSMVRAESSQLYDTSSYLAGIPLDSGGNVSFPANTEFSNVDKGVYVANYGNGRQAMFFNEEVYKGSSKLDDSRAVRVQIGDAGFYAIDTSPSGGGLGKVNTYQQSNDYMDMNQFSGARISHRTPEGKQYSENRSTIDASRGSEGRLTVSYNNGTKEGAILFDATMYSPKGGNSYNKVSSRDGREYYVVDLNESGQAKSKASFTQIDSSPQAVAKRQFLDKSYNKAVYGESSVTRNAPKTFSQADEDWQQENLTREMLYYGEDYIMGEEYDQFDPRV